MSRFESGHSQEGSELAGSYFLTADLFLFFANPAALMILDLVRKREMTSLAITRKLGMNHQNVLDKLRAMEREGLLVSSGQSKSAFFRIANSHISKAFGQILEFPERNLKRTLRSTKSIGLHPLLKSSSPKLDPAKSKATLK